MAAHCTIELSLRSSYKCHLGWRRLSPCYFIRTPNWHWVTWLPKYLTHWMDSDVPLLPWYGPSLSLCQFHSCCWFTDSSTSSVVYNQLTHHSTNATRYRCRLRFFSRGPRALICGTLYPMKNELTSLDSQVSFRRQLKTCLFRDSYPDFCC